ncbi:MAG: DNA gyrase subunit A [Bacteroidales bacterium]
MELEEVKGKIIPIDIETEMKSAYIDYSMSVIVSRALPDVRDGLKPVHRRVLFGMHELGINSNQATKKSARIVGEVLGKYHPHGDSSVYEAMVRMAQEWNMRYMLVEGQGNFGSIDGDSAAAMRYTEARFQKISEECLADLDKDTVDYKSNFDDTLKEPTVLPAKAPLLLLNGSSGIAVGMATNMAPHNLCETTDAICAYIDNPEIDTDGLMQYIKAPDFPTGGIIQGIQGAKDAYETGHGRIVTRGKTDIEVASTGRETIVITEIPYLVNKKELIEKIAELVESKKIEGISYINDESDHKGMRIVIKLKMGTVANVVLNTLFKYTPLQNSFSINNIALVDGRPKLLNLKQLIKYFVKHRHEVVIRRSKFELRQAEKRAHILEALLKALDIIDEIIALIKASKTAVEAKQNLMKAYDFSEVQANAIVEMKLRQLTGLERAKLQKEYDELMALINKLNEFLADEGLQFVKIKEELQELKAKYGDPRRSKIELAAGDFNPEDFYPDEDEVITISHLGYIKRTPLIDYKLQNRGGVGSKGSKTRDEDFIEHLYVANMHSTILFFTQNGKCYWLKVYEIPEGSKTSKGRAIQNVINIEPNDKVRAYINTEDLKDEEYINNNFIILATKKGVIKKTTLEAYSRPRTNGIIAITVKDGDQLIDAELTDGHSDILLASKKGKCVRFEEKGVRSIGRTASGVRGIKIEENNEVIGMICVKGTEEEKNASHVMVVSENGIGKRSLLENYRITKRGGKGVKTINITEKTGPLVSMKLVGDDDDLMIINKSGIIIREAISTIRIAGRATQGVKLINIRHNDAIAAVCIVEREDEVENTEGVEDVEGTEGSNGLEDNTDNAED